jgi:hypothetical protein
MHPERPPPNRHRVVGCRRFPRPAPETFRFALFLASLRENAAISLPPSSFSGINRVAKKKKISAEKLRDTFVSFGLTFALCYSFQFFHICTHHLLWIHFRCA